MPDSANLDYTAQLVMLREMTKRFKIIHEAQSLQLQLWPYLVDNTLDGIKEGELVSPAVRVAINIEDKKIEYTWSGSKLDPFASDYRARLDVLLRDIGFLLGGGWTVDVVLDGNTIFSGATTIFQGEIQIDAVSLKRRAGKKGRAKKPVRKSRTRVAKRRRKK